MTRYFGWGYLSGPEFHAGMGYFSGGRTLLTHFPGGALPLDAAVDTQATRQAKHCAHRGIPIEQSVLGSLALWKQNKGTYKKNIRVCARVG